MKNSISVLLSLVLCCALYSQGCKSLTEPSNDFWKKVAVPAVHTNALAYDKAGTLYAGTDNGVYVSHNNGDSWTLIGIASSKVRSIGCDSIGRIFVGTETAGIVISSDGGTTWATSNSGLPAQDSIGIVQTFAFQAPSVVLAGLSGGPNNLRHGLYKSTNSGSSWRKLDSLFFSDIYAAAIAPNGNYIAGGPGHLSFSSDGGVHWIQYTSNVPNTLSITVGTNGYAYAGVLYSGASAIFPSTDYGVTWLPGQSFSSSSTVVTVNALAVSPKNLLYAAVSPFGVYGSANNGSTFSQNNSGFSGSNPSVKVLIITKAGMIFTVNDEGGGTVIYRSSSAVQ